MTLWIAAAVLGIVNGVAVSLTQKANPLLIPLQVLFWSGLAYAATVRWLLGRGAAT